MYECVYVHVYYATTYGMAVVNNGLFTSGSAALSEW